MAPPTVVLPPPVVVTPGAYPQPYAVAPPPFRVQPAPPPHRFRSPPLKPKRRYGDAGAAFTFGLGGDLRFRNDPGYRKLHAAKRQSELALFASYDLFQPIERLVLAAGASYRYAALGDDETLELKNHALQAELIARLTATRWLFPQLRAGVGVQLSRADLEDELGNFKAHDRSTGATGSLGLGLAFQTPRRLFETHRGRLASLSFAFLIEGGYVFASAADYRLKVKSDSDLPSARIALGKLDQSGAYLRLAGVLRF